MAADDVHMQSNIALSGGGIDKSSFDSENYVPHDVRDEFDIHVGNDVCDPYFASGKKKSSGSICVNGVPQSQKMSLLDGASHCGSGGGGRTYNLRDQVVNRRKEELQAKKESFIGSVMGSPGSSPTHRGSGRNTNLNQSRNTNSLPNNSPLRAASPQPNMHYNQYNGQQRYDDNDLVIAEAGGNGVSRSSSRSGQNVNVAVCADGGDVNAQELKGDFQPTPDSGVEKSTADGGPVSGGDTSHAESSNANSGAENVARNQNQNESPMGDEDETEDNGVAQHEGSHNRQKPAQGEGDAPVSCQMESFDMGHMDSPIEHAVANFSPSDQFTESPSCDVQGVSPDGGQGGDLEMRNFSAGNRNAEGNHNEAAPSPREVGSINSQISTAVSTGAAGNSAKATPRIGGSVKGTPRVGGSVRKSNLPPPPRRAYPLEIYQKTQHVSSLYPNMIWATNHGYLACATMFTIFFGGSDFTPHLKINRRISKLYSCYEGPKDGSRDSHADPDCIVVTSLVRGNRISKRHILRARMNEY
jgi:hypothetical protein